MTIRNIDSFLEGVWDWGFLDQCFEGTKIKVSDIDGIVERKGKFLAIEVKQKGVPVKPGQQRLYDELWKTGRFTIVYVWGQQNVTEEMKVCYPTHKTAKKAATNEDLIRVVKWWFDYANHTKVVSIKEVRPCRH